MRTKTRISDPPHPLESKMLRTKLRRTPPTTTVWQENFVSNDGFFGLSLSVLRGGGRPVGWKDISMRPKEGGRGSKGSVRNLTGLGKKTTSKGRVFAEVGKAPQSRALGT